jgi:transcriptional regulator with XRE-family HTH domain
VNNVNKLKIFELKKAVGFMNIVKFGANISRLRKERDIPQSKLADTLNVTRQAVSKWERGEGFPDITLLCSLAEVFGTSVDALINAGEASGNEAAILTSVTQNQEIAKEVFEDKNVIQDIINIAPYLKVSTLSSMAEQLAKHNINISKIIELSEFMNDESIVKLFENSNLETLDDKLLEKLIPFLDSDSLYEVLDKVLRGKNGTGLLKVMSPYISHELIETAFIYGMLDDKRETASIYA